MLIYASNAHKQGHPDSAISPVFALSYLYCNVMQRSHLISFAQQLARYCQKLTDYYHRTFQF